MSQSACQACGSFDYHLLDGNYFCTVCQTQSQDVREEEREETVFRDKVKAISVDISKKITQEGRNKNEQLNYDFQWTTNDAFNIILKELVDRLIELGASPVLKETILRLWVMFLKKTSYAFCKAPWMTKDWVPKVPVLSRERDEQVLLENQKIIVARKFRKNFLKSTNYLIQRRAQRKKNIRNAPRKKTNTRINAESIVKPVEGDDVEKNKSSDEILENEPIEKLNEKSTGSYELLAAKAKKKKPATAYKRKTVRRTRQNTVSVKTVGAIGRMSIERVIEFLYLGLLLVHENVLLCDLLNWIDNSTIPLRECRHLLPDCMKFQTYDNSVFRLVNSPSHQTLRKNTAKLAKLLDVHTLPPKSLWVIVERFVRELNLPGEMNYLVEELINLDPPQMPHHDVNKKRTVRSIPNYEGRALAFIIVVLKLLFGLDGKTERKQSKYSRKLREEFPDEKFFVWSDWVSFATERLELHKRKCLFRNIDDLENFKDVDQIIHYYENIGEKQRAKKRELKKSYAYMRNDLREPLRESIVKLLPQFENVHPNLDSTNDIMTSAGENFHLFTFRHITNPTQIKHELSRKQISLKIINSSAWTELDSPRSEKPSLVVYQPSFSYSFTHYWRNYNDSYNYLSAAKLSASFVWFIDLCSFISNVPAKSIYEEVMLTERILIKGSLVKTVKEANSIDLLRQRNW